MIDTENMEYNTTRNHLTMREYGRHIQKMVEYLLSLEDKEKRQKNAYALIELMGFLNPHLKNVEDFRHKLWDHLFLISDFKLDVESPYPIPTRETLKAKPERLAYPKKYPKFNHLGKNIEVVIDKALKEENPEKRQGFANSIAYYMKLTYSNWHKELVHDDNIQSELQSITDGELEFNNRPFVKHRTDNRPADDYGSGGRRDNNRRNFGQRNNNGGGGGRRDGGSGGRRDGGGGGRSGDNRNNNNRNFKKRY
ncbi:DUF4290 domain-containing protein [Ferruginibacter lapsinanis]|uniref:DUF4290 domain-containing protein n=1 Tax=Ferruginibacter lapsinanis TaxID=563172 RepID=UPI001E43892A|nr:DUF4290 domain-containing protein [Ferruginibacter lapsinanis]UEG50494.1 DUF4290 domain-containing protein [Ferruginibacter lapsinanis]